jgi:hypothetical protein
MPSRILFLCLLLLSFSLACSKKNSDESANSTAPNTQQDQSSASAPPSSAAPTDNTTPPASNKLATTSPGKAKPLAERPSTVAKTPAAVPAPLVIPEGTAITVRLQNAVSSGTAQTGDTFDATVASPIQVDGKTVVPAGSVARGTVAEAKAKGKIKGDARLRLELTELAMNGSSYPVQASMSGFSEKGKGKRTAATTGGGAALGAIIGGIAGGGKGAAIGALVGGGAGFAGGTFTGNKQIELPAESALTFTLKQPITVK